jgi:phospholipid/cholesterol/gamma-HCH transport system substrate-binding protein
MRTTASLVKLLVFAVVTVLATGLLAATIGNIRLVDEKHYRAVFSDVTGLTTGDDIRVAGVRVGEVESIDVHHGDEALVGFSVQSDRSLSTSTRAMVRYRNLVGQRYIALTRGPGSGDMLPGGGTIPMRHTSPALDLTVLFNGFKPLFRALSPHDVNRLALEIIKTLQGEGGTVNSLLAHTASLTSTLADRDAVIGRTVDNLNSVLRTLDERDDKLSQLIVSLQRFVSKTATYGSWFNFYLCDFEGRVRVPTGVTTKKLEAYTVDYHSTAARCQR